LPLSTCSAAVKIIARVIAAGEASILDAGLPLLELLGGLALVAAQFGDQREHARGDAIDLAWSLPSPCNPGRAGRWRPRGRRPCPRPVAATFAFLRHDTCTRTGRLLS